MTHSYKRKSIDGNLSWSSVTAELVQISAVGLESKDKEVFLINMHENAALTTSAHAVLVSIVVSIPACHAGDRGSIPRRGVYFAIHKLLHWFMVHTPL